MVKNVNLYLISKYRTQLMGIAALLILACHANVYGIEVVTPIKKMLMYGNCGVDIFLFLSAIGCYFSLAKTKNNILFWYKKRFIRIFIPYFLVQIPFWLLSIIHDNFNIVDELFIFSTIKYWTTHIGAWYIALLIPTYLITPFLFIIYEKTRKKILLTICICSFIWYICSIDLSWIEINRFPTLISNFQWAFSRCINFIIGFYFAPLVYNKKKLNLFTTGGIFLALFIVIHVLLPNLFVAWLLVVPICLFSVYCFELLKDRNLINNILVWLGTISLESYLCNIYLCTWIKKLGNIYSISIINSPNGYVGYTAVIVLGLCLANLVHILSAKIKPN